MLGVVMCGVVRAGLEPPGSLWGMSGLVGALCGVGFSEMSDKASSQKSSSPAAEGLGYEFRRD